LGVIALKPRLHNIFFLSIRKISIFPYFLLDTKKKLERKKHVSWKKVSFVWEQKFFKTDLFFNTFQWVHFYGESGLVDQASPTPLVDEPALTKRVRLINQGLGYSGRCRFPLRFPTFAVPAHRLCIPGLFCLSIYFFRFSRNVKELSWISQHLIEWPTKKAKRKIGVCAK